MHLFSKRLFFVIQIVSTFFLRAKMLRDSGMGIFADLAKAIVERRKKLTDKFKAVKMEGKGAFFKTAEPEKLHIEGR